MTSAPGAVRDCVACFGSRRRLPIILVMHAFREAGVAPEPESWCAGFPLISARPMIQAEADAVTTLARRALRAWWRTIAILGAVLLLPLALRDYRAPNIGAWGAVIVSALVGLGYVFSILVTVRQAYVLWRTRARLLADRRQGTVLEFGGVLSTVRSDESQRALLQAGVVTSGRSREQRFAVLPVSSGVIHRDARRGLQTVTVRVRNVAAPPTYQMRVPVTAEIARVTDPQQELVRRSLSPAEREEIRHYIPSLGRVIPRLLFFIGYGAIGVMFLVGWLGSATHRLTGLLPPAIVFYFFTREMRMLVITLRRTSLLSRDIATGWVLTVQPRTCMELDVGDIAPLTPPVKEFLPISGIVWTENGRPATWRDLQP